jgi:transcriptional regulator with XRE-family HTH domain
MLGCMERMLDRDTGEVMAILRGAVASSGLSQAGFARAMGTSAARLSTYLNGETRPSA